MDIGYYTTGIVQDVSRWLARGFIISAMIYALSATSGAHLNPAVSFGFTVRRLFPLQSAMLYTCAQLVGASAASLLVWLRWGQQIGLGASHPGPNVAPFDAFVVEVILAFLMMTDIIATADGPSAVGKQSAIAIGFVVAACGFAGGTLSGACMNPARSVPDQILAQLGGLSWIYIAAPMLGASLASLAAPLLVGPPEARESESVQGD